MRIDYSIVFVSDMSRAIAFYRDVIGLPLKFETPAWTEFATDGATLALHETSAAALEPRTGDDPAGTVRLGFNVPDLDAFHARMVEKGVRCTQEPAERFGARLAQYVGFDGVVFSVGESRD